MRKLYTDRIEASVTPETRGEIDALSKILMTSASAVIRQVIARGILAMKADMRPFTEGNHHRPAIGVTHVTHFPTPDV